MDANLYRDAATDREKLYNFFQIHLFSLNEMCENSAPGPMRYNQA